MAWKVLLNEVEFLAQFPMVGLAISDSPSPIPGYLYGEINAITYVENGIHCKPLAAFLVSRLQSTTPFIATKVLKLLLYLVQNGHEEFINAIKFHEVPLKEAMGFHGPPDDLHGRTFYENIRKMAKELLEFIFAENKITGSCISQTALPGMGGYGSTASLTKMPGFGHTVKTQKSVTEKVSDGLTNLVEKFKASNDKEKQAIQMSYLNESIPKYKPLIIDKSQSDCNVSSFEEKPLSVQQATVLAHAKRKVRVYKPGQPGGGWADPCNTDDTITEVLPEGTSKISSTSTDSLEMSKIDLQSSTDWVDEHKIVNEFIVNEPLQKLRYDYILSQCKRCASLNCDQVLKFLMDKLSSKELNVRLRIFVFMEYLLFYDIITAESLRKIVLPVLTSTTIENAEEQIKLKAKKLSLIVHCLSKHQQKQGIEPN
ncbi:AP-4 complex accessory subunit tepsin-like isoform X2 [Stegodyphus dumicola]|uniref:AP-4 complex accessory subunit tepsin-like isoform X2 n=1 Tax=Stegodyphus dumicola TaxID=202533 RepID=UPI0015B07468|nr:AP-4 complex accessory subunit tepsin-like isoform X2 [Stegodyphus dumicola]